jgi:hypothetical protein
MLAETGKGRGEGDMGNGIAAPEPRTMVTVLGLTVDHVHVIDARQSRSEVHVVRVELGDVHVAGDLHTMRQVVARVAEGLEVIADARNGRGPDLA